MTITQLEYIIALNKHQNFARAAKSCSVTQPTLSMQIQKLEDEIGVVLFDRSKSPVRPTSEGEKLISQAQKILNEVQKFHDISKSDSELSGPFRIGVIPTLAPYVIPLFADTFSKQYPKIDLFIEELKTDEILEALEKETIDTGILVTPLPDSKMIERHLFFEKLYAFFSPKHPNLKNKTVKENELKLDDLWLLQEGHCLRNQMLNICSKKGATPNTNLHFESENLETLKNIVLQGCGYTIVPELASKSLSSTHKKLMRSFSGKAPSREVSIINKRFFHKESAINALEEVILSNLPKEIKSLKKNDVKVINI